MAIQEPEVIASNKLQIVVGVPLLYFAILTSAMHMEWVWAVARRLGSGCSYAPAVYNSFPWPETTPAKGRQIGDLAQAVFDARRQFPDANLGDLYDPDFMPAALRRAHENLDRDVDRLYNRNGFRFGGERVPHPLALFEASAAPLAAESSRGRRPGKSVSGNAV